MSRNPPRTIATNITRPYAVSLRRTVSSHGWVHLAPWEWSDERGELSRPDRLPSGTIARITATQATPTSVCVVVAADVPSALALREARALVVRWLSIAWDPQPAIAAASAIDPAIADHIRGGGGRFLRCSTFYEDFAKTVCTINTSWAGTIRMVRGLVDLIGNGTFPTPEGVVAAGIDALRADARLGFRSRVLLEATREMLARGMIDELGNGEEGRVTYDSLIELRGIGSYAASHLAMLLHDFSRIPVDSSVRRSCAERLGLAEDEIEPFFDAWGDYRFLGYRLGFIVG